MAQGVDNLPFPVDNFGPDKIWDQCLQIIKENVNLARAWRIHLGWTQKAVAKRASISQSALSQIERTENSRSATLEKLAKAMGLAI